MVEFRALTFVLLFAMHTAVGLLCIVYIVRMFLCRPTLGALIYAGPRISLAIALYEVR